MNRSARRGTLLSHVDTDELLKNVSSELDKYVIDI
jgi:hypothetical protein